MADHNLPLLTSTYSNFVTELDNRFDDITKMLDPATVTTAVTNIATNSIQWNSATNTWRKWNGTSWSTYWTTTLDLNNLTTSGNATISGSIGIGISPTYKLDIQGTSVTGNATSLRLYRTTAAVGNTNALLWQSSTLTTASISDEVSSATSGSLIFKTALSSALTERMRIDPTGNVGIGIVPTLPLHVLGTTSAVAGSAQRYNQYLVDSTAFAAGVGGGVVFAGYTDAALTTVGFAGLQGIKENATSANTAGALIFTTRANTANMAERMRIDSNGNVGIGIAAPQHSLHVSSIGDSVAYTTTSVSLGSPFIVSRVQNTNATSGTPVLQGFYASGDGTGYWYNGMVGGTGSYGSYVIGQRTGVSTYTERLRISSTSLSTTGVSWLTNNQGISTGTTVSGATQFFASGASIGATQYGFLSSTTTVAASSAYHSFYAAGTPNTIADTLVSGFTSALPLRAGTAVNLINSFRKNNLVWVIVDTWPAGTTNGMLPGLYCTTAATTIGLNANNVIFSVSAITLATPSVTATVGLGSTTITFSAGTTLNAGTRIYTAADVYVGTLASSITAATTGTLVAGAAVALTAGSTIHYTFNAVSFYNVGADTALLTEVGNVKSYSNTLNFYNSSTGTAMNFFDSSVAINADLNITGSFRLAGNLYATGVITSQDGGSLDIYPGTVDGLDNSYVTLNGGGGAISNLRGAGIVAYGNEHANTGGMLLYTGNVAGSYLSIQINAIERLRIDSSGNIGIGGNAAVAALIAGVSTTTGQNIYFKEASTNGAFATFFRQATSGASVIGYGVGYSATASGFASSYAAATARSAIKVGSGITFFAAASSTTAIGTDITMTQTLAIDKGTTLALEGATSAAGTGIAFPATQLASSNANTLDDYDEYTAASTACTGAIVTACIWKLTKVGNKVTVTIPNVQGAGVATTNFTIGLAIPAKYRPSADIAVRGGVLINNAVALAAPPLIKVLAATGVMSVWIDGTEAGNFTVTANAGLKYATSISWTI